MEPGPASMNVQAQWILDAGIQPAVVNQLLVQFDSPVNPESTTPEGAYLTFGHLNPPLFNLPAGEEPTPDMMAALVLPVMPAARVYCSFDRLKAFSDQLAATLATIEGAAKA